MTLTADLTRDAAAGPRWDVVVVGAGPAGAVTAHALAGRGVSVLLVDRAEFPRTKVCGSCLTPRALGLLAHAGLGHLPDRLGAVSLDRLQLAAGGRRASLRLPGGVALSRTALDAALVDEARARGVHFLPGTRASLGDVAGETRLVRLHRDGSSVVACARLVIAADGLGGRLLHGDRREVAADSRLGAGVLCTNADHAYEPGTIYMACGHAGYVGLVRVEDGRLDIAAAFDASAVTAAGGLGQLASAVLREAGLPAVPTLESQPWKGTPALTRRAATLGAERVLVVGDAAGYVEPFTGEGIAWAFAAAIAVVPLALEAVQEWREDVVGRWSAAHREAVAGRQTICRLLARGLRHPVLVRLLVSLLGRAPFVANPVLRRLNSTSHIFGDVRP